MANSFIAYGQGIPRGKRVWDSANLSHQTERNRFYEETHCMLKTILILGISPVTVSREGFAEYMPRSKRTLGCAVLLLAFEAFALLVFAKTVMVVTLKSYNFRTFSRYLVMLMALVPALISPLATWMEKDGVINYINSWFLLQRRYESMTNTTIGHIFEGARRISRIGTFLSLLVPTLIGLWVVFSSVSDVVKLSVSVLPSSYGNVTNYLLFSFWFVNVRTISRLIKDYGKHFEQRIVHNPRVTSKMIEEYRLLWVEISMLTHRLSSLFIEKISTQLIVQMVNTIISVYAWIFYAADMTVIRLDGLVLHIFYICSSLFLLISYCNSGYTIGKLGEKRVVSKLLSADSFSRHKSSKTKFQIVLFLYSVKCFPPNINLSGFYGVNRHTLIKVLGASVTNIVVLIQFRLATEDSLHLWTHET